MPLTPKDAGLKLLSGGLITVGEAARLAGMSRQLMRHHARNLNPTARREQHLRELFDAALDLQEEKNG